MNFKTHDKSWNRRYGNPAGSLPPAAPLPRAARAPKNQDLRLALGERLCNLSFRAAPALWMNGLARGMPQAAQPQAELQAMPGALAEADALLGIRAYVKHAVSAVNAGKLAFRETNQGIQITSLGMQLWQLLPQLGRLTSHLKADTRHDPYVQHGLQACRQVGLHRGAGCMGGPVRLIGSWLHQGYNLPAMASLFNMFLQELGRHGDRTAMGRALQVHEDLHKRRMGELRVYFRDLVKHHPCCHLERLELSRQRGATATEHDDYRLMVDASARFMRRVKKQFGRVIVGDVRKVDHAANGGYQVHVLLALDGPGEQEFATIRQAMSECWTREAPAKAHVVDCNAIPSLMYRGTGALARTHETLASQLDKAAMFLAGTDRIRHVGYGGAQDGLMIGMLADRPLP